MLPTGPTLPHPSAPLRYADLSPGVWWEDINPTYTAFIGSSPGPSPASGGGSAPSPSGSKGPYKLPILSVYTVGHGCPIVHV